MVQKIFVMLFIAFVSQVSAAAILHFKSGDVDAQKINSANLLQNFVKQNGQKTTTGTVDITAGSTANFAADYIVQFASSPTMQDLKDLHAMQIRVESYMPDHAYLVHARASQLQTLVQHPRVVAVLPYQTQWKLSSAVMPLSVLSQDQVSNYLIRTNNVKAVGALAAHIQNANLGQILAVGHKSIGLKTNRALLAQLLQKSGIEFVEPMPQIELLDFSPGVEALAERSGAHGPRGVAGDYSDLSGYESGTKVINFDAAWSRGFSGEGQIASMADTGLDSGNVSSLHPDFANVIGGGSFGIYATDWSDPMGHGTHVAGSISGTGKQSNGRLKSGAYSSKFYAEGMWSPIMQGLTVPTKISDLFTSAYQQNARIHSNSWGGQTFGVYDNMAAGVDEFVWDHPDMLILFAAGNSGCDKDQDGVIDPNSIGSPATAKNILSVGASENLVSVGGIQKKLSELRNGKECWGVGPLADDTLSNNPEGLAAFSSRGPTADGRIKPDIVAPGTNILSVHSQVKDASPLWGLYNNDYAWAGGTSMATPITASAATVTREYLVKAAHVANPSAALLKAFMIQTAHDMFPGQFGVGKYQEIPKPRPNIQEGYGRVDMDAITNAAPSTFLADETAGVAAGETKSYKVTLKKPGMFRATMAYSDAPASSSAAKALVNDLDLVVIDPAGKTYTLNDHTNNVEMIEMNSAAGTYEIRVVGTAVPMGKSGKQPFALTVTQ